MTTAEAAKHFGKEALYTIPGTELKVRVVVRDYKFVFGRHDWQVEPVAGSGKAWVRGTSLDLDPLGTPGATGWNKVAK